MNKITSTQNETIKQVATLQTPKGRKEHEQFIVEGFRAIEAFIDSKHQPLECFVYEDLAYEVQKIGVACEATIVSESVMRKISSSKSPSGILAVFALPEAPSPEKLTSGLVLANITNPGNMGTLIRSCAAFGYKSVIVVDGCDPYSPKVIQSTAGTLPLVNVFRWTWNQLQEYKKDLKLCALVVKDGKSYKDLDLNNLLFVVGNEAHGIKPEWLETCDTTITLPMSGNTESLNAAVAGSLALALKSL